MPQLNPAPWFLTLMTAWMIIMILLTPKLLKTHFMTEPKLDTNTKINQPWTWSWY
uniref:ATP synthase complex subunit 8 n=1 Tax=Rhacodactylus willihenkeli TaxID=3061933 RepID=A0AA50EY05_9SAUR|nr:ATP synthase F0 subunit 8 [Rhacodactylus sp. KGeiss-2023a]